MAIINQLPHPTSGGGGGGGGETETVIWTNPSPSSSKADADYTLTQGLSNFDKIRIEYAYANSRDSADYSVTYPVYDADGNYMFPSGNNNAKMAVLLQNASGYVMARAGYVKSDTVLHFNTATRVGGSSTSNTALIPWNIYGINVGSSGGGGSDIPVYDGPYRVTPKADTAQILATAGKQLTENVTVAKVPYYETSNTSGTTVYIAEETN